MGFVHKPVLTTTQRHLDKKLGVRCMPTQTPTTRPILHDAIPVGSDFAGGAEAMPVQPGDPGPIVPGSDFAGGALPMTAEVEQGQPNEERAA
jgi:hypothetical protein